jgi:hypothetical protein
VADRDMGQAPRERFDRRGAPAEAFAERTQFAKHLMWHADVSSIRGRRPAVALRLLAPAHQAEDAERLIAALRAALMACWRAWIGASLPPVFIRSDNSDGATPSVCKRADAACTADLAPGRFVVVAPHTLASSPRAPHVGPATEVPSSIGRSSQDGLNMTPPAQPPTQTPCARPSAPQVQPGP